MCDLEFVLQTVPVHKFGVVIIGEKEFESPILVDEMIPAIGIEDVMFSMQQTVKRGLVP